VPVDLELVQGDRVSIVGETDDGMIQALATVLGPTAPDWYAGRLDDGSDVEFRIDQVEEVLGPGYELGGFSDWFKRKPKPSESRSLIPIEPAPTLYVSPTGVAMYEGPPKKKGLLAPIKEGVKKLFAQVTEGPSIFDIFRSSTSIVPGVSTTPAPYEKPPSIMATFMPPEAALAPLVEKMTALMPPPGPTPLAPYIEKAKELFQHVQPSPEPIPYEEKVAKQQELFKEMFEESKEEESLSKMFEEFESEKEKKEKLKPFPKKSVVTPKTVEIPETVYEHGRPDMAIKPLPMPPRREVFPTVHDVARGLLGFLRRDFFDDMKDLGEKLEKEGTEYHKEPLETIGLHDGHPDPIEGMSIFLQIPWEEFRKRAVIEDLGDGNEEWVDVSQITEEIMYPALAIINEAFELIKPDDVPGYFSAEYSEDCGCLNIYYIYQARELTEEEQEYVDQYGELPPESVESQEEEEEAPKRAPKKKAAKKKKTKRARR
jgi:hypothetical protein